MLYVKRLIRSSIRDLQNTLDLALNEAEQIALKLVRGEADAVIDARREEGARIINNIEQQHREIIKTLDEQEAIQRAAALRAVRLQFDFVEASLRAQYLPQFQRAGGDRASQQVLLESVGRDIERLRRDEIAAATGASARVGQTFGGLRADATAQRDSAIAGGKGSSRKYWRAIG